MFEPITAFLTSLKQTSPAIFGGIALGTCIILFSTGGFIESIGFRDFRNSNLPFLGGLFIISISVLSAQIIRNVFSNCKTIALKWLEYYKGRRLRQAMIFGLTNLTPDEKSYLLPYIAHQKTSVNFLMQDGIKSSIEEKGIIYQASTLGDMLNGWAYNLQPWAREHLERNQNLLSNASDAFENRFGSYY